MLECLTALAIYSVLPTLFWTYLKFYSPNIADGSFAREVFAIPIALTYDLRTYNGELPMGLCVGLAQVGLQI